MRNLAFIILLSIFSCKSRLSEQIFTVHQHAIDSFRIVDFIDDRELFNLTKLNDSEMIGFSYYNQLLCKYKKIDSKFIRVDSFFIKNSFYFKACFLDRENNIQFIGKDSGYGINKWYEFDLQNRTLMFKCLLDLELPVLKDKYRIFHLQHQPVLTDDSSFIFDIAAIDPYTFQKSLHEKVYLRVFLKGDSIDNKEQFLNKPASLIGHIMPHNIHCKDDSKVMTVFPCIDTIYTYDLNTRIEQQFAIQNPNFTKAHIYDSKRWMEADYNTEMRINSFYYQGVFFNQKTNHIVLFYTTPADKNIKVPSYEDKKFYALVLDTNYVIVKNVLFPEKFTTPTGFLSTEQGIFMSVFNQNECDDKKCTYYLFDL